MNNVKIYDINDDGTLKFNPDINHLMYLWIMKYLPVYMFKFLILYLLNKLNKN